jgi:hypothetical protein
MYVKGKMILVETIKEWEEVKENGRGGEFKYIYSIARTFVNASMCSHPAQQ